MPYATANLTAELELFDNAKNWKSYWASIIRPYVRGRVLEVGAGSGGSTPFLAAAAAEWICLEPDPTLAARLHQKLDSGSLPPHCRLETSTLQNLPVDERFDAILYLDVLEHLPDHRGEAALAAQHLAPGGALIVLSPAHQFLFSPFDKAVGHHRRYSRSSLRAAIPDSLSLVKLVYLDSVGILLSLANRLILRSAAPSEASLRIWDGWVVPVSQRLDPLFGYSIGKSVLGIWRKPTA